MPGSPSAVGPLFFWTGGAPRGALGGLANTGFGGSGGFCNPSSEIDIGFVGSIVTIFVAEAYEEASVLPTSMPTVAVSSSATGLGCGWAALTTKGVLVGLSTPPLAPEVPTADGLGITIGACAMAIAGIRPKRDINSLVFIRLLLIFAW